MLGGAHEETSVRTVEVSSWVSNDDELRVEMTTQVLGDPMTRSIAEPEALPRPVPELRPRRRVWFAVGGGLIAAGIVAGALGRAWMVTHSGIDSDEAVVGLMASQILHGHLTAFYWGQSYGGVEPYVVAAVFAVVGQSAVSLVLVPAVLMAATAVLTWRAARRLVEDRWLAASAGVVVWAVPMLGFTDTTEYGFRNLALAVGVAILLMSLRILDGRVTAIDVTGLGLLVGVGWWASSEIAFFLFPALLLCLGAVVGTWTSRGARFWLPRIAMTLLGIGVGALPWLWSNVPDGFRSLRASQVTVAGSGGYLSHLAVFFRDVLPLQLGVHRAVDGALLLPGALGLISEVLVFAVLVASLLICLLQGGRGRAIAGGVLVFPLLYALNPLVSFWNDGRYAVYLSPLTALCVVMGCERLARLFVQRLRSPTAHSRRSPSELARRAARVGISLLGVVVVSAAAVGLAWVVRGSRHPVLSVDPNTVTLREITLLRQQGIRVGYANYWVAYRLDFLSDGALAFSPAPWDQVRTPSIADEAGRAPRSAWLFVPPAELAATAGQFGTEDLQPGFLSEVAFERSLFARGIPYSVVHIGFFDAIVPQRTLTARQAAFG
jgi:hypothetical protein